MNTQHDVAQTNTRAFSSSNADLINRAGQASLMDTPALVIDLDQLEHNISAMADWARRSNVKLRPHAKTHKSAEIAARQLAAGAVGICVAKISEAQQLLSRGIGRILITSPVVTDRKIAALLAMNKVAEELLVVLDNAEVATRLDRAARGTNEIIQVLIDVGMGSNRTGVVSPEQALELAGKISACGNLKLRGIQAYAGAVQHMEPFEQRRVLSGEAQAYIRQVRDSLAIAGYDLGIVTGGGTGSCAFDLGAGLFTDLQLGSYVFFDVEYNLVHRGSDFPQSLRTSLFVQTTVISSNVVSRPTTDAGLKAFATDGPLPTIAAGAPQPAYYKFMGDEQGAVVLPAGTHLPVGSVIRCVTPHCDPTVNLYDCFHCIRGDTLVDIWPVDARGRSQ